MYIAQHLPPLPSRLKIPIPRRTRRFLREEETTTIFDSYLPVAVEAAEKSPRAIQSHPSTHPMPVRDPAVVFLTDSRKLRFRSRENSGPRESPEGIRFVRTTTRVCSRARYSAASKFSIPYGEVKPMTGACRRGRLVQSRQRRREIGKVVVSSNS